MHASLPLFSLQSMSSVIALSLTDGHAAAASDTATLGQCQITYWCTRWTAVTQKRCLRRVASLLAPFAVPCSACNTLRLVEGLHKQLPSCFLPRARSKYRHPTVNDSMVCDEQVIAGPDSRLLLSLIRCEGMRNGVH